MTEIKMSRNIGHGRAVDITGLSDARLDSLLGITCTECGIDLDVDCGCFDDMPEDSGWGDAPEHGYDY